MQFLFEGVLNDEKIISITRAFGELPYGRPALAVRVNYNRAAADHFPRLVG